MKSSLPNDVDIINNYFDEKLNEFGEEVDKFFEHINMIIDNITDYDKENEEVLINNIKKCLLKYSDEIITLLNEYDVKKEHIITFRNFNLILEKLKIEINDDDLEYLLYIMKKDVPENHSIMDLNYSIIENLIKNNDLSSNKNNSYSKISIKSNSNLNDSNSKKSNNKSKEININSNTIDENEIIKKSLNNKSEKNTKTFNYNVENYLKNKKLLKDENINDIFKRLKNSIEEKNEDFEEIIEKNSNKIYLNNIQINGITKTIFSNILKEHDIEIDEELLNEIYQKFKLENNIDNNDELMNGDEIKNWFNN